MLGFSSNEGAIPLLLVKGENTEKQPRVKGIHSSMKNYAFPSRKGGIIITMYNMKLSL